MQQQQQAFIYWVRLVTMKYFTLDEKVFHSANFPENFFKTIIRTSEKRNEQENPHSLFRYTRKMCWFLLSIYVKLFVNLFQRSNQNTHSKHTHIHFTCGNFVYFLLSSIVFRINGFSFNVKCTKWKRNEKKSTLIMAIISTFPLPHKSKLQKWGWMNVILYMYTFVSSVQCKGT